MASIQDVYGHLKTLTKKWFYDKTEVDNKLSNKESTSNKTTTLSSSSTNTQYPSAKAVYDAIQNAEINSGSGGSGNCISNFYIDTETDEIIIEANGSGSGSGGSVNIVTEWEQTLSDEKVPSEKLTKLSIDDKANINHNHTKSQITDFPAIPSKTSDLQNDSGFITSSSISNMLTTSNVANDLNTTTSGKVLDARQGKVLNDLIGQAITYINQ